MLRSNPFFIGDFLHSALLRVLVCGAYNLVPVWGVTPVLENVTQYVVGGEIRHAKREVYMFMVVRRFAAGPFSASAEDGMAMLDAAAGAGVLGNCVGGFTDGDLLGFGSDCGSFVRRVVFVVRWWIRGRATISDMEWRVDVVALEVHARALDADFLERDHEHAEELVAALQTQALVLPVGFVEEDDVEGQR